MNQHPIDPYVNFHIFLQIRWIIRAQNLTLQRQFAENKQIYLCQAHTVSAKTNAHFLS